VCGVRRVDECREKDCEWWNDEVKLTVASKERAFEEWLQVKLVAVYNNCRKAKKGEAYDDDNESLFRPGI
jgi:hypothetical protein